MYTVKVDRECGCFRRSDLENNVNFDSKDDALIRAISMSNQMNDEFCGKHGFGVAESGNDIVISMQMPGQTSQNSGGCCGGACS